MGAAISTNLNPNSALKNNSLTITVLSRADMDRQLEEGADLLRRLAERQGGIHGIMATRHSAVDFTLELHPGVPFGTTRERQAW